MNHRADATRVFGGWKPGDKDDDGVLLLVAWAGLYRALKSPQGITEASPGKLFATVLFRHLKKATWLVV